MPESEIGCLSSKEGVIAKAFPVNDSDVQIAELQTGDDPVAVSNEFSKEQPSKSPFEIAGVMLDGKIWTTKITPSYQGRVATLGDILIPEKNVPAEFFIDEKSRTQWEYLKGSKREPRKTSSGHEYWYTEGAMTFPDPLDKPSRTIITGEGGSAPSRFKHVIQAKSGRLRRLTPVELERLNMFPDNHTEGSTNITRAFLMGNALVTGVIQKLGQALASALTVTTSPDDNVSDEINKCVPVVYIVPHKMKKDELEQMVFFEKQVLVYQTKCASILHGTYRKTCRKWIEKNLRYNLPMTEEKLHATPELRNITQLVLTRKKDSPLYFKINGWQWITKQGLEKLGYPVNAKHPKSMTYLLYSLAARDGTEKIRKP